MESSLLATAMVHLRWEGHKSPPLRVMCDTGAQCNMVTARFAQLLQWPTQQCSVRFSGIGGMVGRPNTRKIVCELISRFSNTPLATIELVIVSRIIDEWLPKSNISDEIIPLEIRPKLADPNFHNSAPIDALLGAGVWAAVIQEGCFTNRLGIAFQPSSFGWLIFGGGIQCNALTMGVAVESDREAQLDPLLRRFWEMEEIQPGRIRTSEQEQCEEIFLETHRRMANGRYEVTIPLRGTPEQLGSSKASALHRYRQLERRFERDPELKQKYQIAIDEMIQADHMRIADRPPVGPCYHIPHHPVTTKFRVVFDASCRTDRGVSLNEMQLIGEKLQDDLADLVMRFRCHPVAVTADIRKMYLQVRIRPEQWDLQRVFWRPDAQSDIKEYWLTVVTFGMSSAPHCAVRAMIQGARDSKPQFPMGAGAIENDFYMDDVLTGAENDEQARRLSYEMDALLRSYGFILHKWRSNRPNIVPSSENQPQTDEALALSEFTDTTILGLRWLPGTDELMFKFQPPPALSAKEATKRKLLSNIAQIFDPNGYLGPVVIVAKIIMQKLWRTGLDWDKLVPDTIYREWQQFQQELPLITQIRLPRWLGTCDQKGVTLHGFADASESAYGAVLYARVETQDSVECTLIAAKSRVAPVKTVTIPRLELCAAQLLSELVQAFRKSAKCAHVKATLWSDSEIVLAWLIKNAAELKTFVNNRVQKIKRLTSDCDWRHVPSGDNPADLLSRGMSPAELQGARLWWNGPVWLKRSVEHWPVVRRKLSTQLTEQWAAELKTSNPADNGNAKLRPTLKRLVGAIGIERQEIDLLARTNNAHELFRKTAWILRFVKNCWKSLEDRRQRHSQSAKQGEHRRQLLDTHTITSEHPLKNEEIERAMHFWLRREQRIYYAKEIGTLETNKGKPHEERKSIDRTSAIFKFNPELSYDGILRLGGRLERSLLPFEQKHPALLPDISPLARLLVHQAHIRTLHGGPRQMAGLLRQKWWITNLRRLIHTNNYRCIACTRQRQECVQQMMGNLPTDRVIPCRPFRHSGVDYAGPFELKARGGRSTLIEKKYVAVFICMVTKAVHLELAEDLSTAEFIQAFLRFTSIRGACTQLWSDNGKNFVGAEKELARMLRSWKDVDMSQKLSQYGTEWHFITPSAPHQGGLWEAAVKAMKHHLRRVIGPHKLTSSAFHTVLAQTSAVMNSRPLAALSDDPKDLEFLTPAHFFLMEPIVQPFGANVQDIPDNRLKHAARIQKMGQQIWKAWSQDYLHEYQQRPKWATERENLKIGDLVLIKHENTPPTLWKTGRVIQIFQGSDGLVRNVRLKTTTGELERPVQKLCLLLPTEIEAETSRGQGVEAGTKLNSTWDG